MIAETLISLTIIAIVVSGVGYTYHRTQKMKEKSKMYKEKMDKLNEGFLQAIREGNVLAAERISNESKKVLKEYYGN